MKNIKYTLLFACLCFSFCSPFNPNVVSKTLPDNQVIKLNMFLNAVGVESDGFPYIKASVDFMSNSTSCDVTYDNPKFKDTSYSFTLKEIDTLKILLASCNLKELKKEYTIGATDQPTSITTIYTITDTFYIKDYGLQANAPLPDLYRIIYKLNKNYR